MIQKQLCTACNEQPATCFSAVDYRSDTDIAVCETCVGILHQHMRNDYYHKRDKAFYEENKDILKNAEEELFREYERLSKRHGGA